MATASLALPTDVRTQVFRKIVNLLQTDPVLARLVGNPKGGRWYVWDGDPASAQEFDGQDGVSMRLTAKLGSMAWLDETEQLCPLKITIEYLVPGWDLDDPLNLQGCIERALFPPGAAQTTANALVALGAETGMITFDEPLLAQAEADNADGLWHGVCRFSLNIRRTLNP